MWSVIVSERSTEASMNLTWNGKNYRRESMQGACRCTETFNIFRYVRRYIHIRKDICTVSGQRFARFGQGCNWLGIKV